MFAKKKKMAMERANILAIGASVMLLIYVSKDGFNHVISYKRTLQVVYFMKIT